MDIATRTRRYLELEAQCRLGAHRSPMICSHHHGFLLLVQDLPKAPYFPFHHICLQMMAKEGTQQASKPVSNELTSMILTIEVPEVFE